MKVSMVAARSTMIVAGSRSLATGACEGARLELSPNFGDELSVEAAAVWERGGAGAARPGRRYRRRLQSAAAPLRDRRHHRDTVRDITRLTDCPLFRGKVTRTVDRRTAARALPGGSAGAPPQPRGKEQQRCAMASGIRVLAVSYSNRRLLVRVSETKESLSSTRNPITWLLSSVGRITNPVRL